MNRRHFFKMGGLTLGAISPLGLSLPQVLANEATGSGKQINVIFMFLQGGASQLDMYDMKPDAPIEVRGKYHPISTNVPGIQLSDQLPKLAQCADKFSLIRSMHSFANDHGAGDVDIMCGSPRDKNMQAPGIGAVLTRQKKQLAPVPPFVHLGDMKHPRHSAPGYGGYLGHAYDPFLITQDANSPSFSVNTFDTPENVDLTRLGGRKSLLRSLDLFQSDQENKFEFARTHDVFTEKALGLATSTNAKKAFDLSKEPEKLRDAYGRNQVGQGMLLARRSDPPLTTNTRPPTPHRHTHTLPPRIPAARRPSSGPGACSAWSSRAPSRPGTTAARASAPRPCSASPPPWSCPRRRGCGALHVLLRRFPRPNGFGTCT